MIVVSLETENDQKAILDKAVKYFVDNVGLKISEQGSCCVVFKGKNQIGYVKVTISKKDKKFKVDVESRDYEYWAKKFVEEF